MYPDFAAFDRKRMLERDRVADAVVRLHERRIRRAVEMLPEGFFQHTQAVAAPWLSALEKSVQVLQNVRRERVGKNRSATQRTRTPLHTTLKPGYEHALPKCADSELDDGIVVFPVVPQLAVVESRLDLFRVVCGSEKWREQLWRPAIRMKRRPQGQARIPGVNRHEHVGETFRLPGDGIDSGVIEQAAGQTELTVGRPLPYVLQQ